MTWWAIDLRVAPPDLVSRLAEWLVQRTGQAVEERPDAVIAAVPDAGNAEVLLADLAHAFPDARFTVRTYALEDQDWAVRWRDGLVARRVGRLTVVPSWVSYIPSPDEVVVRIDPETAFGTGEHGSTRATLLLLQRHLVSAHRVIDFGSGSGILSIAAARLGAARATGIELDAEAVAVAERNAERNGVAERCAFLVGDAAELGPLLGPADVVASNILRNVNVGLLPAIRSTLAPGGLTLLSGMEETESTLFLPSLAEAGFEVFDQTCDAGWWAVAARPC